MEVTAEAVKEEVMVGEMAVAMVAAMAAGTVVEGRAEVMEEEKVVAPAVVMAAARVVEVRAVVASEVAREAVETAAAVAGVVARAGVVRVEAATGVVARSRPSAREAEEAVVEREVGAGAARGMWVVVVTAEAVVEAGLVAEARVVARGAVDMGVETVEVKVVVVMEAVAWAGSRSGARNPCSRCPIRTVLAPPHRRTMCRQSPDTHFHQPRKCKYRNTSSGGVMVRR